MRYTFVPIVPRVHNNWQKTLSRLCTYVAIACGLFACASASTDLVKAHEEPVATVAAGGTYPERLDHVERKEIVVPTTEVRTQCNGLYDPCRRAALYEAVAALPDGTVLASTAQRDSSTGPLEVLTPSGTRCLTPIRCTSFVAHPSGALWCIYAKHAMGMTSGWKHEPAQSEAELSYTLDSGATWHWSRIVTVGLEPEASGLSTVDGFRFTDSSGQVWQVTAHPKNSEIRIRRIGAKLPGGSGSSVAFFADGKTCVKGQSIFGEPVIPYVGKLFCLDEHSDKWLATETTSFLGSASTMKTWWGVDNKEQLFYSPIDVIRWRKVDGGVGFKVYSISQQGEANGTLLAVASKEAAQFIIKLDPNGHVLEWIPTENRHITAFDGGGGRVTIGSLEGVYTFDAHSWKQLMPPCRDQ